MTRDGLHNVTGSSSYDGGTAWAGQISDRQRLVPLLLPTSNVPLNLDNLHLRQGEAAGAHGHSTVTWGWLDTAVVISVRLVAGVTNHINFIWLGDRRRWSRWGGVCTGYSRGATLWDGASLGQRIVRIQLFESPSQVAVFSMQLLFVHWVFSLSVLQVLDKTLRFREQP